MTLKEEGNGNNTTSSGANLEHALIEELYNGGAYGHWVALDQSENSIIN